MGKAAFLRRISYLIPLIVMITGFFLGAIHVYAGDPYNWVIPKQIPALEDYNQTPVYISWEKSVYCFSTQKVNDQFVVVFSRWTLGQGWTLPKDIFTHPLQNELVVLDAFLEEDGTLHLIFFAGDQLVANIYYSQSKIWEIDRAQAWAPVTAIGLNATPPPAGQIIREREGELVVVYSGKSEGNGVYVVTSTDNGTTWSSKPDLIISTNREDLKPYSLDMLRDQQGDLHAVWVLMNNDGHGEFVYYAKTQPDSMVWSASILAVWGEGLGTYDASIVENQGELFVIYHNDDSGTTRWMRRSRDLGQTWEPAMRLFPHVGSNGPASLVVDSSGQVHMFFGNRVGSPAIHGMWHSLWDGRRWAEPVAVVSGPRIVDIPGGRGFDPYSAMAVVVEGNLIFLTWRTDPGAGYNGFWYTYKFVDTPMITGETIPMITITPAISATIASSTTESAPQHTSQPIPSQANLPGSSSGNAVGRPLGLIVALSIIPVVVIIAIILAVSVRMRT